MRRKFSIAATFFLLAGILLPVLSSEVSAASTIVFADSSFQKTWNIADSLVNNGTASRSWLWGNGFTSTGFEQNNESPGGMRRIQYFDKARMEINNPYGNKDDHYYVTNGLLVKELVSGRVSLGDAASEGETRQPADNVAIAGDPIEGNPNSPTYATFKNIASLSNDHRSTSALNSYVINTVNKDGSTGTNPSIAGLYSGLKVVYYDSSLGHNIPEIFMNFLKARGSILDSSGKVVQDYVLDWQKDVGLPLTEAYWTKAKVSGQDKDVLVQLFERRVLTYTPSNKDPYKVEMGNVGLHYFKWRYPGNSFPAQGANSYPLLRGPHAQPGINADMFEKADEVSGWLTDLKLKWVRQQIRWSEIESVKGQYDFSKLDPIVATMTANGIKMLFSVVKSPTWANPTGGMPLNPQDFANFIAVMGNRYKGKIAAYEMWNEQNLASEAGAPINVKGYVELLKAGYMAVKQQDPYVIVLMGGLSPVGLINVNYAVDDVYYLKQIYAYNNGEVKQYFDVLGAHPGSNANPPDNFWPDNPGPGPGWTTDASFYFRRVEQLRKVMEDNGDATKQVWLTEFGWDSAPNPPDAYGYAKQVTEQLQAKYISRAFEKSYQDYPWMGVMALWQLNFALPNVTNNPNDEKVGWGILNRDGSKRPSYYAVQQYAANWQP